MIYKDLFNNAIKEKEIEKGKEIEVEPTPPFVPPQSIKNNWQGVKEYLVEKNCLSSDHLDVLYRSAKVYADKTNSAIFLSEDENGNLTGAERIGTQEMPNGKYFKGNTWGTKKSLGGFTIHPYLKQEGNPDVMLVKSAIDAISLSYFHRDVKIISVSGGVSVWPEWITQFKNRIVAYGNDKAGQNQCDRMCDSSKGGPSEIYYIRPKLWDWNADLIEKKRKEENEIA